MSHDFFVLIKDAINGVDKNTILRVSMRKVQKAELAMQNDSNSLKIHSLEKLKGRSEKYSAAADCKRILEQDDGGQGMKSSVKSEKRERNRGIKNRYWHLREEFEKLSDFKCATVKIEEEGTTFKDLYHYYTCPEMGQGVLLLLIDSLLTLFVA